jgi:two-component system KDP operon response regulator KdpE
MTEGEAMVDVRVLILAERREDVHQAAERLAAEGCEVQVAQATGAGLAALPARWPDLVLLRFEGSPRPDLLAEVRYRWSMPLLVWAGQGDRAEAVSALQAGADDYLDACLALDELVARILAHLRRARWRSPASHTAYQPAC